ncbi:prenyltransferase/squalene oxidase repeat-containing protein [Nocardioides sp. CN2-186]|uniref:prenyltransferase/squalene oxidase repeat-containing protein n=1 Tax=Nocardioides tweenelious TaxID=3156607 RepID=UPI0032B5AFE0
MHRITRRAAAALAVPALALTGLIATSTPASAAAADPAPAAAGTAWLTAQLTDGLIHNDQYDFTDYGLSVDAGLAFAAVGDADAADTVSTALAANITSYTEPGFGTTLSAGGVAKAIVLAQAAGDDPTSYGGQDLVTQLESTVATAGANEGRIQDSFDPASASDYANVLGQAYAAQGLVEADSDSAAAVTDFLVDQQCDAGWFRLYFSKPGAATQTCDADPESIPDTDATAIALMALVSMHDDALVPVIDKAETWLLSTQKASGAWGGGKSTKGPNANSTGLAGWALAELGGDDAAVANAAAWVRGHQLTNVANCVYFADADRGAIAYNTNAVDAAGATPIDAEKQDQFRRATTQALPVLQYAPVGDGDRNVLFAPDYVKAGSTVSVGVIGATPGEALCAMMGEESVLGFASALGEAHLPVILLKKPGKSTITVANVDGPFGTADVTALGAKKLGLSIKGKVAVGAKQVVKVRGLAPGEMVSVTVKWPSTGHSASGEGTGGQANGKGVFTTSFKAPNKPGTAKVKVTGAFGNRKASKTFTVTR